MVRYTARLKLRVDVEFDCDPSNEDELLSEVVDRLSVEFDNTRGRLVNADIRKVRIEGGDGSRVRVG